MDLIPLADAVPGTFRCSICDVATWCDSLEGWKQAAGPVPPTAGTNVCPNCVAKAHGVYENLEAQRALNVLAEDDETMMQRAARGFLRGRLMTSSSTGGY